MSVRAALELASLDIDIPQNVRSPIPSLKPRSPPNVKKEKNEKKEKARPRSIKFYRPDTENIPFSVS
jgi:predicted transcriptional regulator